MEALFTLIENLFGFIFEILEKIVTYFMGLF